MDDETLWLVALGGFSLGQLAAALVFAIYGRRYIRQHQHLNLERPQTLLWQPGLAWLNDSYFRACRIARMTGHKPRWLTAFELLQGLAFGCALLFPLRVAFEAWRAGW